MISSVRPMPPKMPTAIPTTLLLNPYGGIRCECGAPARYRVHVTTLSATGKPSRGRLNLCSVHYRQFSEQEPTMPPDPITQMLPVDLIRLDGGTQMRARINMDTVAQYADDMAAGDEFPAIDVFYDGDFYWLADGFHRYAAHQMVYPESSASVPPMLAEIHDGTRRDALLYGIKKNRKHGLRFTNADKRFAVESFLEDQEWGKFSDREIARMAGVHHSFVGKVRGELTVVKRQSAAVTFRVGADGRTIDTANIGRTPPAKLKREHTPAEPKPATVVYVPPADGGHALDAPPENGYHADAPAAPVLARTTAGTADYVVEYVKPVMTPTTGSTAVVPNVPRTTGPGDDLAARREHIRHLRAVYQAARESIRAYEEATGDFDSGLPLGRVLPGMVARLDRHLVILATDAEEVAL